MFVFVCSQFQGQSKSKADLHGCHLKSLDKGAPHHETRAVEPRKRIGLEADQREQLIVGVRGCLFDFMLEAC